MPPIPSGKRVLRSRCLVLQSSPEIKAFMAQQGLTSVAELETYFEGRVLGLARQAGRNYIVWQVRCSYSLMGMQSRYAEPHPAAALF